MKNKLSLFLFLIFNILNFMLVGCNTPAKLTPKAPTAQARFSSYTFSDNRADYDNLKKQIIILNYKIAQLTQVIEALRDSHKKDIKALQSQINALKEDQDAISKSLDSISDQLDNVQKRIDNIEKKLSNLEQRLNLLENSYFRLVKVSKNLSTDNKKIKFLLRRDFQILEKEIAYLKIDVGKIKRSLRKIPMIKIERIKPIK